MTGDKLHKFTVLDVILFGDIEEYPIDELNLSQLYSELDIEQRIRAQIAVTVKHFLGIEYILR